MLVSIQKLTRTLYGSNIDSVIKSPTFSFFRVINVRLRFGTLFCQALKTRKPIAWWATFKYWSSYVI